MPMPKDPPRFTVCIQELMPNGTVRKGRGEGETCAEAVSAAEKDLPSEDPENEK